jgi:MYXO-CTERM domain-containing protein
MRSTVSLLALLAVGSFVNSAGAVLPPPSRGPAPGVLELRAGDAVRAYAPTVGVAPASRASAWSRFLRLARGTWDAMWDAHTAVPMAISGAGIYAPGTIASDAEAERFTRAFIAEHIALLAPGSSPSDIRLIDNFSDGEMRTLGFVQTYQGVDVFDTHLIFEFKSDRLFVVGSTAMPDVQVPGSATNATTDAVRAGAMSWLADLGRTLVPGQTSTAIIMPLVRESGAIEYRRVIPVEVTEPNGSGAWTVYVDAGTGAGVARKDNLVYANGVLKYRVPDRAPLFGNRVDRPAAQANISIDGVASKTDSYGALTWTGTAAATVTTNATGTLVTVNNSNAAGVKVTGTVTVTPEGDGIWDLGTTPTSDSQLTCFASVNVVKEHIARFVPRGQIAWLNNAVVCNVNQNQFCNANWNGSSMQFFIAGTSGTNVCENTGRITDVVYHEFGHGFHQNVVTAGGSVNGGMGEGVGDTLAASITQDFRMALGFFTDRPTTPIRDLDTTDQGWPAPSTEVHVQGVTYGGWMYDLRKNLKQIYGDKEGNWVTDRLFYESVRRSTSIPTSYTQVVAADDDDGNTANGTPNFCAIYEAAQRHTLPTAAPGAAQLVPGIAAPTQSGQRVTLKLLGNSFCPTDLSSATASYLAPGSSTPTSVALAKDASGNYVGDLPAQAENTVGQYSVTATFANGKAYTFPDNAADPNYQTYVGSVQNLYCTHFDDATAPADWTHGGTPTDEWEWGSPGEVAGTNDPRAAFSGTHVYGMDLGKWTTDGVYPASGTGYLQSPTINTAGMSVVRLQYRRQLNVETGASDQANIYANDVKVWSNATTANHVDKEWRFHDVDISAQAATGTAQIKFELVANATNNFGGWNIDDFCIVGIPGPQTDAGPDGGAPDAGDDAATPIDADGASDDGASDDGDAASDTAPDSSGPVDVAIDTTNTADARDGAGNVDVRDATMDAGGTAGSGGSAGTGGNAGSAGAGGAAGSAGKAGAAGAGGAAGSGGRAGAAGSAGTGGAGAGGTAGRDSGAAGSGGATDAGMAGGSARDGAADIVADRRPSSDGAAGGSVAEDDGGCSCRVGSEKPRGSAAWLLALALTALRRRSRRSSGKA